MFCDLKVPDLRSDVVEWYEPPVEPGDDASEDEVEEEGSKSRRLGVLMLAFQVKCAKWDPPHKRDFAFVRCLKRPKRSTSSAFSLLEVEKRVRGEDSDVTEKLGKLWTWDNSVRGGQYKVLPVEKILHSLPLMPTFKPNSREYSIDKGMYENPFKLCSRERPPFDWCRCREESAI